MAHVKQLKETLEGSFTNYKRHYAALTGSVNESTNSLRALSSKIETFEIALDGLNAAHTAWVSKAETYSESLKDQMYSPEWLEERWVEADSVLDKAKDMVEEKWRNPNL